MLGATIIITSTLFSVTFGVSTIGGRNFVFNFLQNRFNSYDPFGKIYVINTGSCIASVDISMPLFPSYSQTTHTILPGGFIEHAMPPEAALAGSNKENKGIFLTSDVPVIVEALNVGSYLADGYCIPPVEELGMEHIAVTYRYSGTSVKQGPFFIGLTALEDNTNITVKFTGDQPLSVSYESQTYSNGDTIYEMLNKYQTLQIASSWADGDFTGALITSDRPVFAQAGSECSAVEREQWADHLADVLPPLEKLGIKYFLAPFKWRTTGDTVKVIAAHAMVNVQIYDHYDTLTHSFTLAPYHQEIFVTASSKYHSINADGLIMVVQFIQSKEGETHGKTDPTMVVLRPVNQWETSYMFCQVTKRNGIPYFYYDINIVIKAIDKDGLFLNGITVSPTWIDIGSTGFVAAQVSVSDSILNLTHINCKQFSAVFYGQDFSQSFGFHGRKPVQDFTYCPVMTTSKPTENFSSTATSLEASPKMTPSATYPLSTRLETTVHTFFSTDALFTTEWNTISHPKSDSATTSFPVNLASLRRTTPVLTRSTSETSVRTSSKLGGSVVSHTTSKSETSELSAAASMQSVETLAGNTDDIQTTILNTEGKLTIKVDSFKGTVLASKRAPSQTTSLRTATTVNKDMQSSAPRITSAETGSVQEDKGWSTVALSPTPGKIPIFNHYGKHIKFYWTKCSATCGIGVKRRLKVCNQDFEHCSHKIKNFNHGLVAFDMELSTCMMGSCPVWSVWEPWLNCRSSCGVSTKSRNRTCLSSGKCSGATFEHEYCIQSKCKISTKEVGKGFGIPDMTPADRRPWVNGIFGFFLSLLLLLFILLFFSDWKKMWDDFKYGPSKNIA